MHYIQHATISLYHLRNVRSN